VTSRHSSSRWCGRPAHLREQVAHLLVRQRVEQVALFRVGDTQTPAPPSASKQRKIILPFRRLLDDDVCDVDGCIGRSTSRNWSHCRPVTIPDGLRASIMRLTGGPSSLAGLWGCLVRPRLGYDATSAKTRGRSS